MNLTNHCRLAFAAAMLLMATAVDARPHIMDILAKGSQWTLNVDGDEAKLTLLGGRGGQLADGSFEVFYDVDWGGQEGKLQGLASANNARHEVTLELTRRNGIRVSCRGIVAQESSKMFAGTCGNDVAPGAFYAAAFEPPPPPNPGLIQAHERCKESLNQERLSRRSAEQRSSQLQGRLNSANSQLGSCRAALGNASSGPATESYASFKNRINGRYETGGKSDQVSAVEFPSQPGGNSDLRKWLNAHNQALLDVIDGILRSSDFNAYKSLEQQRCGSNIYCKAGIRQQAIACGLGVSC